MLKLALWVNLGAPLSARLSASYLQPQRVSSCLLLLQPVRVDISIAEADFAILDPTCVDHAIPIEAANATGQTVVRGTATEDVKLPFLLAKSKLTYT